MGLREQIAADTTWILTNEDDFGWPITLMDPSGKSESLIGFSDDISEVIDPQTGEVVSGRFATAVFSMATLTAAGFTSLPEGVMNTAGKPWLVVFDDVYGASHTFNVESSKPDRAMGVVVCHLGTYNP